MAYDIIGNKWHMHQTPEICDVQFKIQHAHSSGLFALKRISGSAAWRYMQITC